MRLSMLDAFTNIEVHFTFKLFLFYLFIYFYIYFNPVIQLMLMSCRFDFCNLKICFLKSI